MKVGDIRNDLEKLKKLFKKKLKDILKILKKELISKAIKYGVFNIFYCK